MTGGLRWLLRLCSVWLVAWPWPAGALTLAEAREQAARVALELVEAEASATAAHHEAGAALGGALPSLAAGASASTGSGLTSSGFERQGALQSSLTGTVRWTVVAPKLWAELGAARATVRGQEALLEARRVEVRAAATGAWMEVAGARAELEALVTTAATATLLADDVAARVEAGLRPPAEGSRARAQAAAVEARLAEARGRVVAACARLGGLLGEPSLACDDVELAEASPQDAGGPHPLVVAADEALEAARANARGALADRAPTVDVAGSAGWYQSGDVTGPGWSAGATLAVPLVASGAGAHTAQARRADVDRAQAARDRTVRDLAVAEAAALARHEAARATLAAARQAAAAAGEAEALLQERWEAGLDPLSDLLQTRQAAEDARVAEARAAAALGQAVADLEAARGVR